jgi:hypothetical protein
MSKQAETQPQNPFTVMLTKNVQEHVEKKGGFAYLSWPYAVAELKKVDPTATWRVCRFGEAQLPFQATDHGYFVEVEVTFFGVAQSHIHPVLNNQNRPIANPNSFEINTSIMRCLVKAIAVATGLGLYIYAGEDLPLETAEGERPAAQEPPKPAAKGKVAPQKEKPVQGGNGQAEKLVADALAKINGAAESKSLDALRAAWIGFFNHYAAAGVSPEDFAKVEAAKDAAKGAING